MGIKSYPVFFRLKYNDGTSKTYILKDEPIGWDKVDIILKRDNTYWGVNYQYSDGDVQLVFSPGYGSEIIKQLYDTFGPDYTIIFQYGYTIGLTEVIDFEGRINLNTYKYDHKKCVSCTIETGGFHANLNTRMDTDVNLFDSSSLDFLPMPAAPAVDITLHSKGIRKRFLCNNLNEDSISETTESGTFYFTFDTQINLLSEFEELQGTVNKTWNQAPYAGTNKLPVWVIKEPGEYEFNLKKAQFTLGGQLYFTGCISNGELSSESCWVLLRIENSNDELVQEIEIFSNLNNPSGGWNLIGGNTFIPGIGRRYVINNFNTKINLSAGDKVYIYGKFSFSVDGCWDQINKGIDTDVFNLDVIGLTKLESSVSKAFLVHEAISRILNSITGYQNALYSDYFGRESLWYGIDGEGSKFAILNGFLIRKFISSGVPLRNLSISLKQVLSSLRAIFCVGLGYEYIDGQLKVRIEKADYFFQPVEILFINDNSEYSEETATDFIPNDIKVGYSKYPEEGDYLLDEFNTEHAYSTPIKTNKKELTIKSDLIASGYAIELTRRLQFEEVPVDSSTYDDNNFIISVINDGEWKSEKNEAFSSVLNVLSPETAYNLRISPKRNLLRWAKIINGGLTWRNNSEGIKNTFYKNNGDASSQITGEPYPIVEKSNIILSDLEGRDRNFKAVWMRFKCRLSPEQVKGIKEAHNGIDLAKKNGYISTYNAHREIVSGYIFDFAYSPATEQATFKLLKTDIQSGGVVVDCADFADYTSDDFETKPLPSWIEDCTFANFN